MFDNHQPLIGAWAQRDPENFAAVGTFVIFTIRQPLERAIADYHAYRAHGDIAPLWGWKLQAVQELENHAPERLQKLHALRLGRPCDRNAMLSEIASWTGFSYVKGGFLLQLVFGLSGCIDSHNERRLGVSMRQRGFTNSLKLPRNRTKRAKEYHWLVDQAGGTRQLWDDWCESIAKRRKDVWRDAFEVSRYHALSVLPTGEIDSGHVNSDIPF